MFEHWFEKYTNSNEKKTPQFLWVNYIVSKIF